MSIPTQDVFGANARPTVEAGLQGCTDLCQVGGATNSNVAATMATVAGTGQNRIKGVFWSYSATPGAQGRLTITDGGNTVYDQDLASGGPAKGSEVFTPPIESPNQLVVTLYAVAAVTGKLVVRGWIQK